jgi:hypothetical protein
MICYSLSNIKEYRKLTTERRQEIVDLIKSTKRKLNLERAILDMHNEISEKDRKCIERYVLKLEQELAKWTRLLSEIKNK